MFFRKKKPYIKFELDGNKINVESYFSNKKDDGEAVELVKNYANMLVIIQSAQLMKQINESVVKNGASNKCYDLALGINKIVVKLLSTFFGGFSQKRVIENKLCMTPEEVFMIKND